jgi:hypothetical protein
LQNPWFDTTASAGRSFSPSGSAAQSGAPPPPPQKRTSYEHRRREKCAWLGTGDRYAGDQFATGGSERGGSGVEAGAGAAEEGDVRGRKGSLQESTGDDKPIRAAAGAGGAGPIPDGQRQVQGDLLREVFLRCGRVAVILRGVGGSFLIARGRRLNVSICGECVLCIFC